MGLDIGSPNEEYSYPYSVIHRIRALAYVHCGGEKEDAVEAMRGKWNNSYDETAVIAYHKFPNLCFHSDCDGNYTLTGQVLAEGDTDLLDGNLPGLVDELNKLKKLAEGLDDRAKKAYKDLLAVASDELENGDGTLKFG